MPDHDRNLLFGLLALQNGLITEDDLLKAFRGWTRDKSRSIEQFLRDQKAITETQCERLEGLLREHLERHGSAEKSLAALTPVAPAIASLRQVDDSALNVSLGHVGKARVDPFATRPPTPDEFGSTPASRFRRLRPHAKGRAGRGQRRARYRTQSRGRAQRNSGSPRRPPREPFSISRRGRDHRRPRTSRHRPRL
jgi:hypothetical protein